MMRLRPFRSIGIIVALLACGTCTSGPAQSSAPPRPQQGQPPEDLANALVQMARASHIPIIAELVWPLPKIPIAEGKVVDSDNLSELVKQAPGYRWKMEGRVLHFYNEKLRRARVNFLNLKFQRFAMPPDLAQLKLRFPGQSKGLLEGYSGSGWATTGFGDTVLAKDNIQQTTLENITPLEILIRVANESPTFYVLLVFPDAEPTKSEAEHRVVWQWGSLSEKLHPLYVQPIASTGNR